MTLPVIAVLAALLVAVAAATVHAHEPVGADFRISSTGADGDAARGGGVPAIAYNSGANEYLVVWHADAQTNDDEFEIFGQRVSASGAELGSDFRISNTGTDGDPARDGAVPAVAYNSAANEYLVTWQGDGLVGDSVEIFGQRVSAAGTELGGDFRISNTGGFPQASFTTAVAYNSTANEYLVTWSGDPLAADNEFEIFGQRVSASGAELGGDFRISTTGTDGDASRDATVPAVAYSSTADEYLVTWQADGLATDEELEIFGQRVSAAGAELGGDFRVSDTGTDGDSARGAIAPALAYNSAAGEYLVTWQGDGLATDDELEIFGQRVSAVGSEVGAQLRISNTGPEGDAARDAVASSVSYNPGANEYLVAWQADGLGTDNEFEIFGQRVSAAGAEQGAEFRISNVGGDGDASRAASFSAVAHNPAADEYLAVWHADGLATDDEVEVFGRRLAIVASTDAPAPGSTPRTVRCRGQSPTILGTPGAETLRGTGARDVIVAGAGNDVVLALGGNDLICAGRGNDELDGGPGADVILGRDGADDLLGGRGGDRLRGGEGSDDLTGGGGRDALLATGSRDDLLGDPGDRCRGGEGRDRIVACKIG